MSGQAEHAVEGGEGVREWWEGGIDALGQHGFADEEGDEVQGSEGGKQKAEGAVAESAVKYIKSEGVNPKDNEGAERGV